MTEDTVRKTVGAAALELQAKGDQKQSVVETQREMQKGYIDEVIKAAQQGEKDYGKEKSFYVCVQTRRERLLTNVIRNIFYARRTRPDPQYDLALYHYDPKQELIRFVWCIPDPATVDYLIENRAILPKEDQELAHFCECFKAGTLV